MGSITTWARLEPHSRSADMDAGLEMRLHDPLWMLARQWQFGELQGEDAGSPVWAQASGVTGAVALYLPGPLEGHVRDDVQDYSSDQPLEYVVADERQPAQDAMTSNRRLAVEAGQHFQRLLGASLANSSRASLLASYAVAALTPAERAALDPESVAFLDIVADRTLDGALLLGAVSDVAAEAGAVALGFQGNAVASAAQAISGWLAWCEQMIGTVAPPSPRRAAWNPERMEYACALAAPSGESTNQVVLVARQYRGGHLDWYSFDTTPGATLQRALTAPGNAFAAATVPTNLGFRGMPASRLWEFEDAQVRFGAIEAGPTDLARLLLVEFLIQYGNDFFTLPLEIVAGSLANLRAMSVTNTFGDVTAVTPFAEQEWRMFAISSDDAMPAHALSTTLFLPPALGQHFTSPPLERVELARDEVANTAWAIEHVVQSKSGTPINRHETDQARRQRDNVSRSLRAGTLTYQLDTWRSVLPDFWIPLIPEQTAPAEAVARLACYDPQGLARGQVLSEKSGAQWLYIFNEEVPRSGAQVTRFHQYTRWYDGLMFTWTGREKRSGRGSASSGLRYDVAQNVAAP